MIFLDNHSTTRVAPEVLQAMLPYFTDEYGNAASVNHAFGTRAAAAVEQAREQVARLLNCPAEWIVFTSGATESNNLAIKGLVGAASPRSRRANIPRTPPALPSEEGEKIVLPHVVTNAAEHRSVLDPVRRLQRQGLIELTILPIDRFAQVDPQQVADAIRPSTVLVSVMLANNEVGTLNPIAEIGRVCRERSVPLHCDAVQAVGKVPVDLNELSVDLLSLSAHKFHGPKGIGVLVVRRGERRLRLEPLFDGGGHEQHLRSGTLPVPLVVGLGVACELCTLTRSASQRLTISTSKPSLSQVLPSLTYRDSRGADEVATLRDRLWSRLQSQLDGLSLNGHPTERLPNNLNISVADVDGEALMMSLTEIAVSSGSACSTADPEPSHVLRAMGVPEPLVRASLRFGLSRFTTAAEIDAAASELIAVVRRLRTTSHRDVQATH